VVDSADRVYELVVSNPHLGTSVVADGRVLSKLEPGDRVRVQRADVRFQQIVVPGHSYYRRLREKLGWGGQLRGSGAESPESKAEGGGRKPAGG
jgi:NAD+ kinase